MGSEMQPFVETPPKVVEPNRYSHRSIETLVVVIAVITIAGVITGMIARLSGGRHFGGNGSCIDGGLPPPPPPPEEPKPAPAPEGDASK
ncbi:hypothetical protein D0Y65_007098 [Glycine soja]|uniref:Uncharacterized protein n=1 Tax=Glycine soja TaxID=3848 RepID=A0A445LBU4_GLYSO|nr:hypothetical protein D0Y65_007098 [Glycine soja]